jgi:hypothetical protein
MLSFFVAPYSRAHLLGFISHDRATLSMVSIWFCHLAVTTANSIVACQKPKATYAVAKTPLSTSYYMFDRSHWIADLMPFTC